ncbi:xanthine dehydrogenase molybdopterin binding subunit [Telmatospirillum siberiense]|uniref:Xanthine dehydrogenase molybdopterin binding subunit n=1 Tax=Telmatospirillum siberiense TaxID=382514 RepID=A0A2N3PVR0_9PROT|nr:xanthine dehydrogenase molybdopterin binding subunit [Telmatospirillum siberiense]PKU24489.1 xanthine dehydrogenase molybdopterin binding subunit [Telmatospirillum siberiense]
MDTATVGHSVSHDSAARHVDGRAVFIDDLPEPRDLLHAHLVTSPWAHARLGAVDLSACLTAPGVVAVVTAADVPGVNDIGAIFKGEPLLPAEFAEYVGHPVAAVAATTPEAARHAASLARIDGEPLPAVFDVRNALEKEHYVCAPMTMARGDAARALAAAPFRLQGETEIGGQDHFYLETHVALATPVDGGALHIYSSTQHPTEVQHLISHILGLPQAAVTVEVRRLGGAFGGKESQASLVAGIASLLAWKTGRPVKLRLDRDDDMTITGKRHGFLLRWDVGFDQEGRILGVDMQLAAGCGWSADLSSSVMSRALSHADNAYFYPAARIRGFCCKTNLQSNTAFRGFGAPQGVIAAEAMLDDIAHHLGRDPLAVRKLNFYGTGGRDLTPYHQTVEHFRLPAMLEHLERSADLAERRQAIDAFNAKSPVIRKGLATVPVKFGVSFNNPMLNQAGALVMAYTDGSILVNHGGIEMGQGLYVKVAQVVAEVFQVPLSTVQVSSTRTDKVPNTSPTAASSGTDLNGMAAQLAAETIRERMAGVAAERFGVPVEEIEFKNGEIRSGNHHMEFAELTALCHAQRVSLSANGYYRTPKIHFDGKTMTGHPFLYYSHGLAAAEVAIDTLTGEWKALRVDILHDVGRSLNPAIDRGQIEGAFLQGMGWLTMEELVWDKEGRLLTHAPSTYKIPTARDLPADLRVELLANADNPEATVYRSKAVGEPPLILAVSVWLALRDAVASLAAPGAPATLGAPATPEHILAAVEAARATLP